MDKVYVLMHKVIESGAEDTIECIKVFRLKSDADAVCAQCNAEIQTEENDADGIDEEYWVSESELA